MSQKYQKEIEEILEQAGELATSRKGRHPRPSFWRLIRLYILRFLGDKGMSLSPGRIMLAAVSLLLVALIFSRLAPGIGGALALLGLLLFIAGYALFFLQPKNVEKRWRGQRVDDSGDSWWGRFRRKKR